MRQLNVADVTRWFDLSLLCGLLGSALFRALLCATLFRCLLSTFFSCHSFFVLLFFSSLLFRFPEPQDAVLSLILWASVNGAQHLAI